MILASSLVVQLRVFIPFSNHQQSFSVRKRSAFLFFRTLASTICTSFDSLVVLLSEGSLTFSLISTDIDISISIFLQQYQCKIVKTSQPTRKICSCATDFSPDFSSCDLLTRGLATKSDCYLHAAICRLRLIVSKIGPTNRST